MKAKKSLGQHFLTSKSALEKICQAGDIRNSDTILEIGPGTGVLTEGLLARAGKVIAVEKDTELIPLLEEKFSDELSSKKLTILQEDILNFDPSSRRSSLLGYKVVANIPYYITGAIIEKFLSTENQPERMVLLIQKEVAERIVARDNKESILSIAVKAYGAPKIIAKVPAGAFNPPPKVDSAILSIENISRDFFTSTDETLFFKVMKGVFGKKRKQIGGTLAEILGNKDMARSDLAGAGIDPKTRPEDINLETWKKLTQAIANRK
ncbi:MAG TPA: 16S rRNA (adenine(1518)-N(6)/adenine(1519)-N(6))-dimethyltransferase RsmA [Candidatus Paceibacterota bacterium]|jgi:16S rRNA (adenine1518-N6/adenine1519-N6)-dimethyltransferase|nr:16S rRNA (adenine(1518)-N(6)/adenine(1519)-N(6))-dimethyltransferase RsmA [Candidatus Paceibacterota bacterium]